MSRRDRGGRPAYRPTTASRRQVLRLASEGFGHREIAATIGIARATLETYFPHELADGAARARAVAVHALWRSARGGKLSAITRLLKLTAAP